MQLGQTYRNESSGKKEQSDGGDHAHRHRFLLRLLGNGVHFARDPVRPFGEEFIGFNTAIFKDVAELMVQLSITTQGS